MRTEWMRRKGHKPMFVAPASREFSTSSFAAVCRSITTWPEVIRWTDWQSMGLIAFVDTELSVTLCDMTP